MVMMVATGVMATEVMVAVVVVAVAAEVDNTF